MQESGAPYHLRGWVGTRSGATRAVRRALPFSPWGRARPFASGWKMQNSKYSVRVDNIYFLSRIGSTLRWVTQDIAPEDLPANVKHLLARLDRLEARARAMTQPNNDPA